MILGKLKDALAFHINVEITTLNTGDVHVPDFDGRFSIEFGVIETDVDAAFKCFVKFTDAVCGEDEYAGIIFQDAEKYLRLLEAVGPWQVNMNHLAYLRQDCSFASHRLFLLLLGTRPPRQAATHNPICGLGRNTALSAAQLRMLLYRCLHT